MQEFFETDIENIKDNLKLFLTTLETFKDYNFDGAATSELLDLLSYSIQYQNLYLNFNSNEQFLKTAEIDDNVYKLAHRLNYIPKRKSASYIETTMQGTTGYITIVPKYTNWILGGTTNLVNLVDFIITDDEVVSVRLYEGEMLTENFVSDGTVDQTYSLEERETIDNDTLLVYVDAPDGAGGYIVSTDVWLNANTKGFEIGDKSYYIEYFESLSLKFDNGNLFQIPSTDERIRVNYLKTTGTIGNGLTGSIELITGQSVTNGDKIASITPSGVLANGTDEEPINAIKIRAPQYYTTLNRAVTERDYNILFKKYSYWDSFKDGIIWGGEKEYIDQNQKLQEVTVTKDLGHVYISTCLLDFDWLSQAQIDDITDYLENFKIITLFFKFLNPVFININPTVSIKYKSTLTLNLESVESQINTFLQSNDGYNKEFYLSDVIRFVDTLSDVVYTTVDYTTSATIKHEEHKVIRLAHEVVPNTISGTVSSFTLDDDGAGKMWWNSIEVGTVNYTTGFITLDYDFPAADTYILNFQYDNKNALSFEKEDFLKHGDITLNILT